MEQNLDKSIFLQELNLLVLSLIVSTFAAVDYFHGKKYSEVSVIKTVEKPLIIKAPEVVPLTLIRGRI